MQQYFACSYLVECLICGNVWTSKLRNCIINRTKRYITSIALATGQWVNRPHSIFQYLTTSRQSNKDSGGGTVKSRESRSCQLCFKNLLSLFISPVSLDWVVSIMWHYCGELLSGSIFKDNKSLKKTEENNNAIHAVWVFIALFFYILFCKKNVVIGKAYTTVILLLKSKRKGIS